MTNFLSSGGGWDVPAQPGVLPEGIPLGPQRQALEASQAELGQGQGGGPL